MLCDEKVTLSVSMLNGYIEKLLGMDELLGDVYVKGEISNFTAQKSGHLYFSLKDENAQIRAVCFRSYASRIPFKPSDGMKVIVHGRVTVYAPNGNYQILVDEVQPDGVGSLALQFEQLKKRLQEEGLFDESKKKPLPQNPRRIGVITSDSGAAIHDIVNIISRRHPLGEIILFPSAVQGEGASEEMILGLGVFQAICPVDVIIIGRGGGSMEDLWCFNDEALVRAVASCTVPTVSAVGHESDFTLCDFAADRRAPTPSGAAELVTPDVSVTKRLLAQRLDGMAADAKDLLAGERQRLALLRNRRAFRGTDGFIGALREKLDAKANALVRPLNYKLTVERTRFASSVKHLNAVNPTAVLERGFTLTAKDGAPVTTAGGLNKGDRVTLTFKDGKRDAEIL